MKVMLVLVTLASLPLLKVDATFGPYRLASSPEGALDHTDLEYLRQQYERPKRSGHGSGDILNSLKSKIGQGIKSKLSHLGKASASASGHFVHKASGHHYPSEDNKSFDIFAFKKSVLYTLLQAIKAIKGGVVAIKGQLIKGGGQLLTAKGHILRGGGEALTELGKSIATSAFMIIPHVTSGEHEAENYEYVHPSSYGHTGAEGHHGHPSGPSGPSAPSAPEYGPTGGYHHKYNSVYDGKPPNHRHDGIVILKKKKQPRQRYTEHEGQETQTSDFRPMTDPPSVGPEKPSPYPSAQNYYQYLSEPLKVDDNYFQYSPETVENKPALSGGSIFVTPTPEMQEEYNKPNIYIGMNFPYPVRTSANYAQPSPSPTQFLIDYPDSKESYSDYPTRVSRRSPRKGPTGRLKRQPSKYVRSFAYRPDDPTTTY